MSSLSKDWASYEAHGCATKLHVVFDPGAETPVHLAVTPARTNDITAVKAMPIEAGRTYVFDLGYYDFGWWAELLAKDCRFVTRLKKNTPTRLVAERPVAKQGAILADRVVRLPERLAYARKNPCACDLARSRRLDTGKVLSRRLQRPRGAGRGESPGTYRTRSQIELFFRWVKQIVEDPQVHRHQ